MDAIDAACPPVVVERLAAADLTAEQDPALFSWVAENAPIPCQVAAVVAVADRLGPASHPLVISDFCGSVATYARFLDDDAKAAVRAAYLRIPYDRAYHASYFLGLRATGIDLRDHLRGAVIEDWRFEHPRRDAEAWHHALYLASLGDADAYDRIARKIAATPNGNDATNFLKSLAELRTPEARAILRTYADDMRRADGPEGPELTIAETVAILLESF